MDNVWDEESSCVQEELSKRFSSGKLLLSTLKLDFETPITATKRGLQESQLAFQVEATEY